MADAKTVGSEMVVPALLRRVAALLDHPADPAAALAEAQALAAEARRQAQSLDLQPPERRQRLETCLTRLVEAPEFRRELLDLAGEAQCVFSDHLDVGLGGV